MMFHMKLPRIFQGKTVFHVKQSVQKKCLIFHKNANFLLIAC